jgi:hypothetical protein
MAGAVRANIAAEQTYSTRTKTDQAYKWSANTPSSGRPGADQAAEQEQSRGGFAWTHSNEAPLNLPSRATGLTSTAGADVMPNSVTQTGYRWGIRSDADQTGYRWGIRSNADQTGYRWGIRSNANQSGYRWGIRSDAAQTGYRWGIRSDADQTGYRWGIRSNANQTGYRWGIRSDANQSGYRWGIR